MDYQVESIYIFINRHSIWGNNELHGEVSDGSAITTKMVESYKYAIIMFYLSRSDRSWFRSNVVAWYIIISWRLKDREKFQLLISFYTLSMVNLIKIENRKLTDVTIILPTCRLSYEVNDFQWMIFKPVAFIDIQIQLYTHWRWYAIRVDRWLKPVIMLMIVQLHISPIGITLMNTDA